MTEAEIIQSLEKIIGEVLMEDDIHLTRATTADDIDGWDSINHVNILVAVEAAFHVRFEAREIGTLSDVGVLVDLIGAKLNAVKA